MTDKKTILEELIHLEKLLKIQFTYLRYPNGQPHNIIQNSINRLKTLLKDDWDGNERNKD